MVLPGESPGVHNALLCRLDDVRRGPTGSTTRYRRSSARPRPVAASYVGRRETFQAAPTIAWRRRALLNVADGASPNSDLYAPAKRPSSKNPLPVATSVTVAAPALLDRSTRRT